MNSSKIQGQEANLLIINEEQIITEDERKRLDYEEDKAYILNEASRFFTPSLRWIESTRNQFIATGKNIKDYFMVETFEAYRIDDFTPPQVRLVWVKKDSSQAKPLVSYTPTDITNL